MIALKRCFANVPNKVRPQTAATSAAGKAEVQKQSRRSSSSGDRLFFLTGKFVLEHSIDVFRNKLADVSSVPRRIFNNGRTDENPSQS